MLEDKLYYSIREVANEFDLTLSALRFWESEFAQLKPQKNKRGVRLYRKQDVDLISQIVYLTRERGYTLDGARKALSQNRIQGGNEEVLQTLGEIKNFLLKLKDNLNAQ